MRSRLRVEEALHPLLVEARRPSVEGPLRRPHLTDPFGCGATEQHQRSNLLVANLFGPPTQQLKLLSLVGRLDPPTSSLAHPSPLATARYAVARGTMPDAEVRDQPTATG